MFVAVAYEDAWYPGEILNISDINLNLKFLHPRRKGALSFTWPIKDDTKDVDKKIVFFRNLTVEPTTGLRSWLIHEHDDVQDSYLEFKDEFCIS